MLQYVRCLCLILSLAVGSAVGASEKAIIVLDVSGSMWGKIDGLTKMSIAQKVLSDVLGAVPESTELGLVAYGHREKSSCTDIELMVPPAAANGRTIANVAARLKPLGKTPLSEAVRYAATALRYTENKATVILITDGIETCAADPCSLAMELWRAGVDFKVHVIGFGLTEAEGRQVA